MSNIEEVKLKPGYEPVELARQEIEAILRKHDVAGIMVLFKPEIGIFRSMLDTSFCHFKEVSSEGPSGRISLVIDAKLSEDEQVEHVYTSWQTVANLAIIMKMAKAQIDTLSEGLKERIGLSDEQATPEVQVIPVSS